MIGGLQNYQPQPRICNEGWIGSKMQLTNLQTLTAMNVGCFNEPRTRQHVARDLPRVPARFEYSQRDGLLLPDDFHRTMMVYSNLTIYVHQTITYGTTCHNTTF
ncbi:Uncharacterized protein Fot_28832 [Forsythia ovata]|uniref:Uncharacterized protein n=1 Tax=Forsythia ovata TaxID=205694 RepID=A0ABD1TQ39_9LAMI